MTTHAQPDAGRRPTLTRKQLRVFATDRRRALLDQRDETIGDAGRYGAYCEFTQVRLRQIDDELARLVRGYRYGIWIERYRFDSHDGRCGSTTTATGRHYATAACALRFAAMLGADADGDFSVHVFDAVTGRPVLPPSPPMDDQIPF